MAAESTACHPHLPQYAAKQEHRRDAPQHRRGRSHAAAASGRLSTLTVCRGDAQGVPRHHSAGLASKARDQRSLAMFGDRS